MSNSFVISGLTEKRAELSGEIREAERQLAQLQSDLAALDATLRLFDPTAKPSTIKPRVKRSAKQQIFRNGELTRLLRRRSDLHSYVVVGNLGNGRNRGGSRIRCVAGNCCVRKICKRSQQKRHTERPWMVAIVERKHLTEVIERAMASGRNDFEV